MSWKCDFCQRIFENKSSYTNHVKNKCLKNAELSEELSLDVMMIDSLESEILLNNNEVRYKKRIK
jgi:hypothetical protein